MRRASIAGPLILIGIGVLFLIRNFNPQLRLFESFALYWPFLLIAWGVFRLGELTMWNTSGRPLASSGPGEWILVVLLCLVGSGSFAAHRAGAYPAGKWRIGGLEVFGDSFEFPVASKELAAPASGRLVIESFRGNARITGSDGAQVRVSGRKSIRALDQPVAAQADRETPVEVVVNGNQVIVRTNQDRVKDRSARVTDDLEIVVPKGISVEAVGRYGDFDISDIQGDIEVVSDNAGVRIQNAGRNVRVDTRRSDIVRAVGVKGNVELKGAGADIELREVDGPVTISGRYSGTVELQKLAKTVRYQGERGVFAAESIPGEVRLTLSDLTASNIVGPVRVTGRSKDVRIADFTQGVEVELDRGDIELRTARNMVGKVDVRLRAGDVDLALPDAARFEIAATTDRGEITNDFNPALSSRSQGKGASLNGGAGDGRVTIATGRGSITVRKATDLPVPPEVPKVPQVPKPPR